jgi:hypothetical protein
MDFKIKKGSKCSLLYYLLPPPEEDEDPEFELLEPPEIFGGLELLV